MNASIVRPIAERAVAALRPFCDRIAIAGSLRRGAHDVKDFEIVCIPRTRDMFEFNRAVNRWQAVKGQAGGKYTQRVVDGVKLDLFMCTSATWPCNMLIRTGCADFSHSVARRALTMNRRFIEAQLWVTTGAAKGEEPIPLNVLPLVEEADVFDALDLPWIDPSRRTGTLEHVLGVRR